MNKTVEKIINDFTVKNNFNSIKIIDTSILCFDPIFRTFCEENICGQYNNNYSCPPICGTYEEMKNKVLSYKNAIVFQSKFIASDLNNNKMIKSFQKAHNIAMFKAISNIDNIDGLLIGSSHCMLCDECLKKENKNCLNNKHKYSCLSAYCINVRKLAYDCNMNYEYKNDELYLFGLYLFN